MVHLVGLQPENSCPAAIVSRPVTLQSKPIILVPSIFLPHRIRLIALLPLNVPSLLRQQSFATVGRLHHLLRASHDHLVWKSRRMKLDHVEKMERDDREDPAPTGLILPCQTDSGKLQSAVLSTCSLLLLE